jgi:hypothetical protein
MVRAHRLKQYAVGGVDLCATRGGRRCIVLCAYAGAPRPRGYARGDQTLEPEPASRQGALNTEAELVAMGARHSCETDRRPRNCVFLLWWVGLRYGAGHT